MNQQQMLEAQFAQEMKEVIEKYGYESAIVLTDVGMSVINEQDSLNIVTRLVNGVVTVATAQQPPITQDELMDDMKGMVEILYNHIEGKCNCCGGELDPTPINNSSEPS